MSEVKHSKALDELITIAKKVGGSESPLLTAERFLVSVLDVLDYSKVIPGENLQAVEILLTEIDLRQMRKSLLSHIQGGGNVIMDDLYMKKRMRAAAEEAERKHLHQITPELVVKAILDEPSAAVKKALSMAPRPAAPEGETKTVSRPEIPGKDADAPKEPEDSLGWIEELTQRVSRIHAALSSAVLGQDHAVSVFTSGYFQSELSALTDEKRVRPCTFLFAGPPGVGKTFLAQTVAKELKLPFQIFDMSEYSDHNSSVEFCGSDKVYTNGKPGNFTSFVSEHPKSVVLFDEIEKAHISIIHLFLQMLDGGRIRDNYSDQEIPLKDVIMIFTTNAGKQLYEDQESGDFSSVTRKVILKALQNDVNPSNGQPFFPAAICSRFASGNVVMFNHITARNLRDIGRKEVLRHAENFRKTFGVNVQIDERIFSALLFAEGGAADARTVRARAETFFDSELFELFRLTGAEASESRIRGIDTIRIGLDLPENEEVRALFESKDRPAVLVFAPDPVADLLQTVDCGCDFIRVASAAEGADVLRRREIRLALLDLNFGIRENGGYLNAEDVDSDARDFFRHLRTACSGLPVYLLQTGDRVFGSEERISFLRQGVRGFLPLGDGAEAAAGMLREIYADLHQQQSMLSLAKANKVVLYETAQRLTDEGKTAEIRLFDFSLSTALDAEDSKNVLSNVSKPKVKFKDVIGADEAKKELQFFVNYLKNPKKYLGTGLRVPRGILLYGPPGTGKTLLAKAMASESDVTFITAEGNQFLRKYVGEGPDKVRELFRTARKYAPSILFIDEIDAIAKERTGGEHSAPAEEILTAFLTQMDGFNTDPSRPVFVLAATNFDVEPGGAKSLDQALMRRFDRRVFIDLPTRDDRVRYMKAKIASGEGIYAVSNGEVENLAVRSTGMSLAELESVFELSLRTAFRSGGSSVTDEILDEAFETFRSGEKKQWDLSVLQRVARHEAGHAFLCWKGGETPSYVTVVARGEHGGYMQHGDHENKPIYTKEELLARIRTSLGGRAAEIVYYGPQDGISTGASGDLVSATRMAQGIVCSYGMDADFGLSVIDSQAASVGELSGEVRDAVNRILTEQMETAVRLIGENRDAIDRLVAALMAKNHLTADEISAVFNGADITE